MNSTKLVKFIRNESVEVFKGFGFDEFTWAMFFIQFAIPMTILSVLYSKVSLKLWYRQIPGNSDEARDQLILKQKKKSLMLMIAVVIAFSICWFPWHLFHCLRLLTTTFKRYQIPIRALRSKNSHKLIKFQITLLQRAQCLFF